MNQSFVQKVLDHLPPANLLPLLIAYTFDHVALSTYWIFFGIWLNDSLTDSFFLVSVVLAVPPIVSTIGTSFFSSFSDKSGRRKGLMLLSRIALSTQYFLLIFFQSSLWIVLVIIGFFALFTQMFYILNSALITTICEPSRRGEISGFQTIFASIGWMLGSAFSGLIYSNFNIKGSLVFAASFALVAGIITMFSPSAPRAKTKQTEETQIVHSTSLKLEGNEPITIPDRGLRLQKNLEEGKTSYFDIFKRPQVLALLGVLAVLEFGFGPVNVMSSIYLQSAGLTENMISLANTCATFVGLVLVLSLGKLLDKKGRKPFLLLSFALYPLMNGLMFFFSFWNQYPWVIFGFYCIPLYALKVPTANAIMSDLTTESERARGMSLVQFEQIFSLNIGGMLGSLIADYTSKGIKIAPIFPMALGIIAFILAFIFLKETNQNYLQSKIPQLRIAEGR
jgi:MFS family permease